MVFYGKILMRVIPMHLSRLWRVILTIALVIGLYMPPVIAAESVRTEADTFNALVQQCLKLNTEESLNACDQAIERNADDLIPWYGRYQALSALGRDEEANQSYAHARVIQTYYGTIGQLFEQWQQIQNILNDETQFSQLEAAINSGELEEEELENLKNLREQLLILRENPTALDERVSDAMIQVRNGFSDALEEISAPTP